jgi:acyl-CoA reductase-like NAD-dependent aldehyde dehydrogenase
MAVAAGPQVLSVVIGGEFRGARSGQLIDAVNPATGEVIARFPRCRAEDVDDAVTAAAEAARGWKRTPAPDRAAMVAALAARRRRSSAKSSRTTPTRASPLRSASSAT